MLYAYHVWTTGKFDWDHLKHVIHFRFLDTPTGERARIITFTPAERVLTKDPQVLSWFKIK